MKHLPLCAVLLILHACAAAGEPAVPKIETNADGSYRCTADSYAAVFSKEGNLTSLKVGNVELLAAAGPSGAAAGFVHKGTLIPFKKITQAAPDSLVCEGDPKDPATALANSPCACNVKATWKFLPDRIEVRQEQSLDQYVPFGWFPSEEFTASHDNMTDQPVHSTGPVLYQQTDPRWTTKSGAVLRFDFGVWQKGFANANWSDINIDGKNRRFMGNTVPGPAPTTAKLFLLSNPAPRDALTFDVSAESPDFLMPGGKPVHFNITARNAGPQPLKATVRFEIKEYLSRKVIGTQKTPVELASQASAPIATDLPLEKPGPYWATISVEDAGGGVARAFTITFVYDFAHYQPDSTRPADFKDFWKEALAESAALPLDAKLTPVPEKNTATMDAFKVNFATLSGRRIYGWYSRPKAPGKYPAHIRFPSSGIYPIAGPEMDDGRCNLWILIHGYDIDLSNMPKEAEAGKNYWTAGIETPKTSMWRTIIISLTRAVDFMLAQPEVNAELLAVTGGSQGGGLSLICAGIDPRVKFCVSHHSGMSRLDWTVKYEPGYWPFNMGAKPKDQSEEQFFKTLAYFDAANFTPDIKCPVVGEFGLMDSVTAPGNQICAVAQIPDGQLHLICSPWAMHGAGSRDSKLSAAAYERFRKGEKPYFTPTKP